MALEQKAYRQNMIYLVLTGFFVTNAIVAELIGGKLINVFGATLSIGVLPWPIVFIATDLINEYFGKKGTRRITLMTTGLIFYVFLLLLGAMSIPAIDGSPIDDASFQRVFGQGMWIIAGSLTAFLLSQLIDVVVFWKFRDLTGGRYLWLRATGSTFVSQLIDTFVVWGIAFWLPGKITTEVYLSGALTSYGYKTIVAIAITPVIYLAHAAIDRYLGKNAAEELIEEAVRDHRQEKAADA
jgi:queuosine precursor transporter